jgi:PAS domain S-box-containing protein
MVDYLKVFNSLPLPCLLLKPGEGNFIIEDTNPAFSKLTGIKQKKVKSTPLLDVFPQDPENMESSWSLMFSDLNKALSTGKRRVLDCFRYDFPGTTDGDYEERYWKVEHIPLTESSKNVKYILQVIEDVTDEVFRTRRKNLIQKELDYNLEQARYFINQNPDGLYSLNREGKFLSVNDGLVKLAEKPEEELLKMTFLPFCAPHHRELVTLHFQRAINGEHQRFEAEFITGKGKNIFLEVTLAPMEIGGKLEGAYGIAKNISRQRKAEETVRIQEDKLTQSERKYKALVQEGSDLTAILDLEGNYKFVSESARRILGIPPDFFIGKNAFEFIHPEDQEGVLAEFEKMGDQKQIQIAPYRFKDGDGKWRWIKATVTNLMDEPAIQGIVANSSDVTGSVENAERLEQLYQRYRLAASATGDLIYDWDLETDNVKRYFDGREKLFGYTEAEVDSKNFWKEKIHPEELEEFNRTLSSTLANPDAPKIMTRYRFRRADGSYAQIVDRGHIVRNGHGKAISIIGATNDISELTEKQQALEISNTRFSYAMKATKEMIWDWDISNDVIKRSKAFKKVYAYQTLEDTVYNSWYDKIHPKDRDRVKSTINQALRQRDIKKWRQEYRLITNNGEKSYVVDRGYILRNEQGKAIRMVGALLDVTESRRLLGSIKKQNKLLKEVAWEQAHIVRSPLVRLKGLLQLLQSDCYELWPRESVLEKIHEAAEEMDDAIKGIINKTEEIEIGE